jgi:hypothetical protein
VSAADLATAAVIVAGATFLLYWSLWRKKGACPGCETGCASGRARAGGLVTLGGAAPGAAPKGQREGGRR